MSALSDLAQDCVDVKEDVQKDCALWTRTLFKWVIQLSPMDTGRFLANWQIGKDNSSFSTLGTSNYTVKLEDVNASIPDNYFANNTQAYIVNNVSYNWQVEYEGWKRTSAYAPVITAEARMIK